MKILYSIKLQEMPPQKLEEAMLEFFAGRLLLLPVWNSGKTIRKVCRRCILSHSADQEIEILRSVIDVESELSLIKWERMSRKLAEKHR